MTPMTIDTHVNLSRRAFAIGAASAAAGLTIGFRWASAQGTQGTPAGPPVPPMIKANPQLDAWVRVAPDGSVTVMTGRVELGQGILTAMRQVAAEELDVAPARIKLISGDTAQTPDEGVTAGSLAVKLGSTALGLACADARATLVGVAAKAWGVEPQAIKVQDGVMSGPAGQRMGYGEAAAKVSLSRPVDVTAKRKSPAEQKIIGTSYPRVDIPAKVFGQQVFIHDLRPEGMLFGAVARPPAYAARLLSADLTAIRAMPGVVEVVRDGSFLGVVARREEQAQAAANRLAKSAKWDAGAPLFGGKSVFEHLLSANSETAVLHEVKAAASPAAVTHQVEYRRDFQAHASIGASCALAQWQDGKVSVWSHTQGPFPLRGDLAKALKVAPETIRVIHAQGSGCYGLNGADTVAYDAALMSQAVGKPVSLFVQLAEGPVRITSSIPPHDRPLIGLARGHQREVRRHVNTAVGQMAFRLLAEASHERGNPAQASQSDRVRLPGRNARHLPRHGTPPWEISCATPRGSRHRKRNLAGPNKPRSADPGERADLSHDAAG
jgi:CO/xanthine dehydrogenase Mo-binding subunit